MKERDANMNASHIMGSVSRRSFNVNAHSGFTAALLADNADCLKPSVYISARAKHQPAGLWQANSQPNN